MSREARPAPMEAYGQWAEVYRRNLWTGVLPLAPRSKSEGLPAGYTGRKAGDRYPDDQQIAQWVRTRAGGNLCLRMPSDVIGIDVDDYEYTHQARGQDGGLLYHPDGSPQMVTGVKTGNVTLGALEDELGELPATWRSSSRGDGPSGIRFYRVPPGLLWGDFGEHLEGIWWGHRYAVVWPSVNPDSGLRYLWIDDREGDDAEWGSPPPKVTDLPDLPAAWVARFGRPADTPRLPAPVAPPRPAGGTGGSPGAGDAAGAAKGHGEHFADTERNFANTEERFAGSHPQGRQFTRRQAADFIEPQLAALRAAQHGNINNLLNTAAKTVGHFVPAFWTDLQAQAMLLEALSHTSYDHAPSALKTIASGLGAADWVAELAQEPTGWTERTQVALRIPGTVPRPAEDDGNGHDDPTPPEAAGFWDTRPLLRYIHDYATQHETSPWAVLGVTLARVISYTEPNIQLPGAPVAIGTPTSTNLYVALVGPSGSGKTVAAKVARQMLDARLGHNKIELHEAPLGSGEGLAHIYMRPPVKPRGGRGRDDDSDLIGLGDASQGPTQYRTRALIKALEIDALDAIGQRRGSTLSAQLRTAWDGDELGFAYADATKRLPVPEQGYRMCLLLGVQPGRAQGLLDQADGGLPQRFLWLPAPNPDLPEYDEDAQLPDEMPPVIWQPPVYLGPRVLLGQAPAVSHAVKRNNRKIQRGDGDALDGHSMLNRLKVAAALAMLLGADTAQQTMVDQEIWALSGVLMAVSDRTREGVQQYLSQQAKLENERRAHAKGRETVVSDGVVEAAGVKRAIAWLRGKIGKEWVRERDLSRGISSRIREFMGQALDHMLTEGEIECEEYRASTLGGTHYRRKR